LGAINNRGHVREHNRRTISISDDNLAVVFVGKYLIVGVDLIRLLWSIEVAFGLVDTRLLKRRPYVFETEPVRRERSWIRLNAHRRLLPAADTHETHAGQLRDLLRE